MSGIGRPLSICFQLSGMGRYSGASKSARSSSSMTCWVPILRARSLPARIQRLTVSGSRRTLLAASGTVSIVAYYNTWARGPVAIIPSSPQTVAAAGAA